MLIPKYEYYANSSRGNTDLKAIKIITDTVNIWYSYNTVIAFQEKGKDVICIENLWKKTTGIHLFYIQYDKTKRLPVEQFEKEFFKVFNEEWKNNYYG